MMRSLAALGHELALLTASDPAPEAIAGLPLILRRTFLQVADAQGPPLRLSRLQERFRSYWGIDPARIRAVARTAEEFRADAVVAVGLDVLPYLAAVEGRLRVWYAADEWAWHHFSQVGLRPSTWSELKQALLKGLYERAYGSLLHRVWVVTDQDRRAMRWVAGVRAIDVVPNGVDGEHYRPLEVPQAKRTCTFWGRLDFGPNIQALEWFCRSVWPLVRRQAPDARFTIYGFGSGNRVKALAEHDGVELVPDLPDLRTAVAGHQVVVLPFVSGGGIKNKLLEAASMGKPMICSPRACTGLRLQDRQPLLIARGPAQWVAHLLSLWQNEGERSRLGREARRWALERHDWQAAAATATAGLDASRREALP
jgi:glycosyltransferase involved in cell wall biosynthesis